MFVFSNIEDVFAYNGAPCFAGIKPSNLFSLSAKDYEQIESIDENFLVQKGFFVKVLCRCKKRAQVLIYNKKTLEKLCSAPEVGRALKLFAYPENSSIEEKLDILAARMADSQDKCKKKPCFPHEIGLFLGYPVYDVLCFCKTKGKGCIFSGYWKVYADAEGAARIFHQYNECKKRFALQIQKGVRLYDLLSA